MERRTFTQLAALAPAYAAAPRANVALLTQAEGAHLSAYIEALAQTPEVETVWLCDPSGATEPAVRKGLGAKLAGSYRSPAVLFAAHKPQLALVTMEAALAPPAVAAALAAGCHILAEKPACVRVADFEPLVAKAKAGGRHLMLALANRLDPVMLEARRIVQAGLIGKLYGMEMRLVADQTRLTREAYQHTWFAHRERAGGGHLIWLGVHWLDLAMYISGSPITQITGFTGNVGGQPIDIEDSAAVSFRFANQTFGNLTSGYYLDRSYEQSLRFWGSQGWVEIDKMRTANPLEWYSTQGPKPEVRRFRSDSPAGYTPLVAHAVRAALGMEKPVLTADESLQVLRTVFAAYRAAETGKTQSVESL